MDTYLGNSLAFANEGQPAPFSRSLSQPRLGEKKREPGNEVAQVDQSDQSQIRQKVTSGSRQSSEGRTALGYKNMNIFTSVRLVRNLGCRFTTDSENDSKPNETKQSRGRKMKFISNSFQDFHR